jgi:transposase InsO family protein
MVATHFSLPVLTLQADNGREFDNHAARAFFDGHVIALRMSRPYTSAQNGHAERMLRTLNECVHAQLTHASMPSTFWAEALATATFLLNRRPCRARQYLTPFELLYCTPPDYSNMRVFGYLVSPT